MKTLRNSLCRRFPLALCTVTLLLATTTVHAFTTSHTTTSTAKGSGVVPYYHYHHHHSRRYVAQIKSPRTQSLYEDDDDDDDDDQRSNIGQMQQRTQQLMNRGQFIREKIAESPYQMSFIWLSDQLIALTTHLRERYQALSSSSSSSSHALDAQALARIHQELSQIEAQLEDYGRLVASALKAPPSDQALQHELDQLSRLSRDMQAHLQVSFTSLDGGSSDSGRKSVVNGQWQPQWMHGKNDLNNNNNGQHHYNNNDKGQRQALSHTYAQAQDSLGRLNQMRHELYAVEDAVEALEQTVVMQERNGYNGGSGDDDEANKNNIPPVTAQPSTFAKSTSASFATSTSTGTTSSSSSTPAKSVTSAIAAGQKTHPPKPGGQRMTTKSTWNPVKTWEPPPPAARGGNTMPWNSSPRGATTVSNDKRPILVQLMGRMMNAWKSLTTYPAERVAPGSSNGNQRWGPPKVATDNDTWQGPYGGSKQDIFQRVTKAEYETEPWESFVEFWKEFTAAPARSSSTTAIRGRETTTTKAPAMAPAPPAPALPKRYEAVAEWAAKQPGRTSVEQVMFQLRNQRVADEVKQAGGTSTRWGDMEVARAVAFAELVWDALDNDFPDTVESETAAASNATVTPAVELTTQTPPVMNEETVETPTEVSVSLPKGTNDSTPSIPVAANGVREMESPPKVPPTPPVNNVPSSEGGNKTPWGAQTFLKEKVVPWNPKDILDGVRSKLEEASKVKPMAKVDSADKPRSTFAAASASDPMERPNEESTTSAKTVSPPSFQSGSTSSPFGNGNTIPGPSNGPRPVWGPPKTAEKNASSSVNSAAPQSPFGNGSTIPGATAKPKPAWSPPSKAVEKAASDLSTPPVKPATLTPFGSGSTMPGASAKPKPAWSPPKAQDESTLSIKPAWSPPSKATEKDVASPKSEAQSPFGSGSTMPGASVKPKPAWSPPKASEKAASVFSVSKPVTQSPFGSGNTIPGVSKPPQKVTSSPPGTPATPSPFGSSSTIPGASGCGKAKPAWSPPKPADKEVPSPVKSVASNPFGSGGGTNVEAFNSIGPGGTKPSWSPPKPAEKVVDSSVTPAKPATSSPFGSGSTIPGPSGGTKPAWGPPKPPEKANESSAPPVKPVTTSPFGSGSTIPGISAGTKPSWSPPWSADKDAGSSVSSSKPVAQSPFGSGSTIPGPSGGTKPVWGPPKAAADKADNSSSPPPANSATPNPFGGSTIPGPSGERKSSWSPPEATSAPPTPAAQSPFGSGSTIPGTSSSAETKPARWSPPKPERTASSPPPHEFSGAPGSLGAKRNKSASWSPPRPTKMAASPPPATSVTQVGSTKPLPKGQSSVPRVKNGASEPAIPNDAFEPASPTDFPFDTTPKTESMGPQKANDKTNGAKQVVNPFAASGIIPGRSSTSSNGVKAAWSPSMVTEKSDSEQPVNPFANSGIIPGGSPQSPGINPNFGMRTKDLGAQEFDVNGVVRKPEPFDSENWNGISSPSFDREKAVFDGSMEAQSERSTNIRSPVADSATSASRKTRMRSVPQGSPIFNVEQTAPWSPQKRQANPAPFLSPTSLARVDRNGSWSPRFQKRQSFTPRVQPQRKSAPSDNYVPGPPQTRTTPVTNVESMRKPTRTGVQESNSWTPGKRERSPGIVPGFGQFTQELGMNGGTLGGDLGLVGSSWTTSTGSPGINPNFGKRTQQLGAQEMGVNGEVHVRQVPPRRRNDSPPPPSGKTPDFSHLSEEFGMKAVGPTSRSRQSVDPVDTRAMRPDHATNTWGEQSSNSWRDPFTMDNSELYRARTQHVAESASAGRSRWGNMENERAVFMSSQSPDQSEPPKSQPPKPQKMKEATPTSSVSRPVEKLYAADQVSPRGRNEPASPKKAYRYRPSIESASHEAWTTPVTDGVSSFLPDQLKSDWLRQKELNKKKNADTSGWLQMKERNSGLSMPGEKPIFEDQAVYTAPQPMSGSNQEMTESTASFPKTSSTGQNNTSTGYTGYQLPSNDPRW